MKTAMTSNNKEVDTTTADKKDESMTRIGQEVNAHQVRLSKVTQTAAVMKKRPVINTT
jgi:hypothetical protein